jgi:menaquinone-9 beta-reductase
VRRTDPLIVGGGPAGSAAAIALARYGAKPLLIERTREAHDVVCGGFLGADALAALSRSGIDAAALGARPIARVRLIAGASVTEAALPFAAAGLSRRTLDAALLAAAEEAGAGIERGVTVRAAEGLQITLADGAALESEALFLATGKHELRGLARPREPEADVSIGLRTRLEPDAALAHAIAGVIELHLFDHGYAGLLAQEDGSVNLCLSVARSRLTAAGGEIAALIDTLASESPRLGDRIAGARSRATWNAIGAVPYGWRAHATEPGIFRLGDQAAVIASLAGDGVAIALSSGIAAARAYREGGAAAATSYQARFAATARRPLAVASSLRFLAERKTAPWLLPLIGHMPGATALLARLTRIAAH